MTPQHRSSQGAPIRVFTERPELASALLVDLVRHVELIAHVACCRPVGLADLVDMDPGHGEAAEPRGQAQRRAAEPLAHCVAPHRVTPVSRGSSVAARHHSRSCLPSPSSSPSMWRAAWRSASLTRCTYPLVTWRLPWPIRSRIVAVVATAPSWVATKWRKPYSV